MNRRNLLKALCVAPVVAPALISKAMACDAIPAVTPEMFGAMPATGVTEACQHMLATNCHGLPSGLVEGATYYVTGVEDNNYSIAPAGWPWIP